MEQKTPQKLIKAYLKRKKPAGKPRVAPKGKTGSKPRSKKLNMFQKMQQDAIDELNTVNRLLKQEPAKQEPAKQVSPLLTEMLQKLSGWTPQSNEVVLEVANRLSQAAKEEIDKATVKQARNDSVKYAEGLLFHTLSYWNGVSAEHSLVIGVDCHKDTKSVTFKMLRVFKYNRLGPLALVYTEPEYDIADIQPSRPGKKEVCLQGRDWKINDPYAMDAIMTTVEKYSGIFTWLIDNATVGKLKKLWDKSKK